VIVLLPVKKQVYFISRKQVTGYLRKNLISISNDINWFKFAFIRVNYSKYPFIVLVTKSYSSHHVFVFF